MRSKTVRRGWSVFVALLIAVGNLVVPADEVQAWDYPVTTAAFLEVEGGGTGVGHRSFTAENSGASVGFNDPARQVFNLHYATPAGCYPDSECDAFMDVWLSPVSGETLKRGTYYAGAAAATRPAEQQVTFRVHWDMMWSCQEGRIEIDDISFSADGLEHVALRFETTDCGRVFGGLTYKSGVDYTDREIWPKRASFGAVHSGAPTRVRQVRIENHGPGRLPVDSVALEDRTGTFAVVEDGCSGTLVAAGDACVVALAFTAAEPGQYTASLRVYDAIASTAGTGHAVSLYGIGPDPPEPLDADFADRGVLLDYWTGGIQGARVATGPDGRITAATGDGGVLRVTRYLADGQPDRSFGDHGLVVVRTAGPHYLAAVGALAVDAAGGVTVVGNVTKGQTSSHDSLNLLVVRLRPDGTPDPTFGTRGRVDTDLGGHEQALGAVVGADGSVLVIGVERSPATVGAGRILLVRYLADGTLDRRFGDDGYTVSSAWEDARISGYAASPDGRLYVVGPSCPAAGGTCQPYLAAFRPDGRLDPAFRDGGVVMLEADGIGGVSDVAVAPDGTLVVLGGTISRYSADGQKLATRLIAEYLGVSPGGNVTVDLAGRVVLASTAELTSGRWPGNGNDFYVARLRPDLSFDTTFGVGGEAVVDLGPFDGVHDIVLGLDGSVLVGGESERRLVLMRFRGTFDAGLPPGFDPDPPALPDVPVPGWPSGPSGRSGYWMVGSDGAVYAFGAAPWLGNAPTAVAVDLEPTSSGGGYWIVDAAGRVFPFGDARPLGNLAAGTLATGETVTSLSATPSGRGYWIFTSQGRVLAFGDAPFLGDLSGLRLVGPVLDSIVTPSGRGYYMVASDGGIFAFGDARFVGSMGGKFLAAPVQSLVPDGDGEGYWLVAADGGVFTFDAVFHGSMGGTRLNRPVTGMVPAGAGYLMVGEDGGIFNFSGWPAGFQGSLGGNPPAKPIVAVSVFP